MVKGIIFFCSSCLILLLTTINFCFGPIITGKANNLLKYNIETLNCLKLKETLKDIKIKGGYEYNEVELQAKYDYDSCQMQKILHFMEYASFTFDLGVGFICGILSLLHLSNVGLDFIKKTALIGIILGLSGFVITLVYAFFNYLVYTTVRITKLGDTYIRRDSDYAYAVKDGDKFKCLFYEDKFFSFSVYAKISDLGKKQYNYDKNWEKNIEKGCSSITNILGCFKDETFKLNNPSSSFNKCKKLYVPASYITKGIENKDLSDRFLTSLILSSLVCLANAVLYIQGVLLCRFPEDF